VATKTTFALHNEAVVAAGVQVRGHSPALTQSHGASHAQCAVVGRTLVATDAVEAVVHVRSAVQNHVDAEVTGCRRRVQTQQVAAEVIASRRGIVPTLSRIEPAADVVQGVSTTGAEVSDFSPMPAETLVAIFVGVETVFGAERVAREPSLGPDVVRVVVRGIRLQTQILALLDHHRAAHGHATPVGRSAVALDGHEAIVDVPVVVYYKHQARVPGRREAVQDRVGVAEVVTSLLGIETAIAIIEFTHALVKFVVAAGSPVRDLPPTATGMDVGREVGIKTRCGLASAARAHDVTFPSGRRREAARARRFGCIFRSATHFARRVFRNCTSGGGCTCLLAVIQAG